MIRSHIINNFKEASIEEFKESIEASIKEKDEITLPGLGVFFEVLWNNSDDKNRNQIISTIKNGIK